MTFGAYVTMADLAVFESCATHPGIDDSETAPLLAAVPQRAVDLGTIGAAAVSIAPLAGKVQSPAAALLTALDLTDTGMPAAATGAAAFLPPGFLEAASGSPGHGPARRRPGGSCAFRETSAKAVRSVIH